MGAHYIRVAFDTHWEAISQTTELFAPPWVDMDSRAESIRSDAEDIALQNAVNRVRYALVEPMAVKCAFKLGIPNIIAQAGPDASLTLEEIAKELPSENPDTDLLFRVMRFLSSKNFFRSTVVNEAKEGHDTRIKYGLTELSESMMKEVSLFMLFNHEAKVAAWHHLDDCILGGEEVGFQRAHNGMDLWKYGSCNPEFNDLFNEAMVCRLPNFIRPFFSTYSDSLRSFKSVVDVGGGLGVTLSEMVKAFPNITTAINYDLPQVVSFVPPLPGIQHVAGDMFVSIPPAEAIYFQNILHDWSDKDCVKILRNCRKVVPENGRVLIVDMVMWEKDDEEVNISKEDVSTMFAKDLNMAVTLGGKERTTKEWKTILQQSGFSRYKFIRLAAFPCLIEAFPML